MVTHQNQNVPVESRDRVVAQSVDRADNVVVDLVVRCYP